MFSCKMQVDNIVPKNGEALINLWLSHLSLNILPKKYTI